MPGKRLDRLLVERDLAESREQGQRLIRAGCIRVNGVVRDKPGHLFAADAAVERMEPPRYVGRGGEKLEGALEYFALDVQGSVCLDAGASTGGFTDCLLRHGAARVYAFDVGHGQLHPRLAGDGRVIVRDRFNVRYLKPGDLPERPVLATVDVSFISLTLVLGPVKDMLLPGGRLLALIKPQFEAGREEVQRGGVVRDPAVHDRVVARIRAFGETQCGLRWMGLCASPLRGPAGNVEFFSYWVRPCNGSG